jgi:hypothetical protein
LSSQEKGGRRQAWTFGNIPQFVTGNPEVIPMQAHHIEAVTVNHNTSLYTELMLRSLFATHSTRLDLSFTVVDNASEDDLLALRALTEQLGISLVQSGFSTQTAWNSHGQVLSRFVHDYQDCSHYLFVDADVCFLEENTIPTMLEELAARPKAFGIGARIANWSGKKEIAEQYRELVYHSRLHPCCALVKNTVLFRTVVQEIGLSCVKYLWAHGEEYWDTFTLMTKVMRTHGFRHILSSKKVLHFFSVSYVSDDAEVVKRKEKRRDELLRAFQ